MYRIRPNRHRSLLLLQHSSRILFICCLCLPRLMFARSVLKAIFLDKMLAFCTCVAPALILFFRARTTREFRTCVFPFVIYWIASIKSVALLNSYLCAGRINSRFSAINNFLRDNQLRTHKG